jgi:hypothetical protein
MIAERCTQADPVKLDAVLAANLPELGYGE